MESSIEIKDILEAIYFITGPLLVYIAYRALGQIEIAKEQIVQNQRLNALNSKRDAMKITSNQVKYYTETIIPSLNKLDKIIEDKKIKLFDNAETVVEEESIRVKPNMNEEDMDNEFDGILNILEEYTDTFNLLEVFSLHMVSGVADEKLAYKSLANTYCYSVKKLMPLYMIYLREETSNSYSSIVKLFILWSNRINQKELEHEKRQIEAKIRKTKTREVKIVGE